LRRFNIRNDDCFQPEEEEGEMNAPVLLRSHRARREELEGKRAEKEGGGRLFFGKINTSCLWQKETTRENRARFVSRKVEGKGIQGKKKHAIK